MKSGLKQLNRRELDTVTAVYFKKMKYARASEEVGISVGYLSHVIEMAMLKLTEYCIPVYPLVCQYRADVEQRKNEVLKQRVYSVGRIKKTKKIEGDILPSFLLFINL